MGYALKLLAKSQGPGHLPYGPEHSGLQPVCDDVLMPALDQKALAEIKHLEAMGQFDKPAATVQNFYCESIVRVPLDQWPDPGKPAFAKLNKKIYVPLEGPSEMGASGKLADWDRSADLPISVPTLSMGARYDTMEPAQMEKIAKKCKTRPILVLSQWQPLGDLRRPESLHGRPHSGCGLGPFLFGSGAAGGSPGTMWGTCYGNGERHPAGKTDGGTRARISYVPTTPARGLLADA
jgi:hypothetical protein